MITLKDYLVGLNLFSEELAGEDGITATAQQVLDYLKGQEFGVVDLSTVTMSERLSITDMEFESFNACTCDFNDGIEIKNCTFKNYLNFQGAYVQELFRLEKVVVGIDLDMPENITILSSNKEINISNLQVKGKIIIVQP